MPQVWQSLSLLHCSIRHWSSSALQSLAPRVPVHDVQAGEDKSGTSAGGVVAVIVGRGASAMVPVATVENGSPAQTE